MKKKPRVAFTIAFLDVLSNALAAVLIITLVKLQPTVLGEPVNGNYFIQVSSLNRQQQDSTLAIAIKFKDVRSFVHEPLEYSETTKSILKYSDAGSVIASFRYEPKITDFDEIIIYCINPDFLKKDGESIVVNLVFPQLGERRKQFVLNIQNDFRINIIKYSKLNM